MRKEHKKLKDPLGSKVSPVSYLLSDTDVLFALVGKIISHNDVHSLHV